MREITDVARRHLAADGAAALSLRAVARDLGLVSSALYRYFPSRDHLLTALIVDAYDALGGAAERAEAAVEDRHDAAARFVAVGRAVRAWARANPHEYALIYGSPVPGYAAPDATIAPALRVTVLLRQILVDAHCAGRLDAEPRPGLAAATADLVRLQDTFFDGVPVPVIGRGLLAWTQVFGSVSFELFGQLHTVITDYDAWFEAVLAELVGSIGLLPRP